MTETARHVVFEACFNFRDLGGYETVEGRRVRWGLLYRSDTLHRLTQADAETFRALGLRTVVDLRSTTEIEDHGRLEVVDDAFTWHNLPMLDNLKLAPRDPSEPPAPPPQEAEPGQGYFMISQQFSPSVAKVFSLLCQDQALPAVYHCTSGKDRTGIVSALVLDLLGVPEDVIADDYVLTDAARKRSMAWIQANEPVFAAFLAQIPPERRVTRRENIIGFLDRFRAEHGSVELFLTGRGVTKEQVDGLRSALLEG